MRSDAVRISRKIESRSLVACSPEGRSMCRYPALNLSLPPSCYSSLLLRTEPALPL